MQAATSSTPPENQAVPERLLAAALQLFNTSGYAATSVREIVEAAGVTKPVLYYYYQNKEGLYLAIMEQTYGIFERRVAEITDSTGTTRERLKRFCLGMFDAFTDHIAIVRLIYAIYFGPPQGAPHYDLNQFYDRMLEIVAGIVDEGIASGELRPGNTKDMTWAVISALNTTMEEQLCQTQPRIDRDGLGRVLDLILDGLAGGANQ